VRTSITLLAPVLTVVSACDLGAAPAGLEEAAAGGAGLVRLGGVDRIEQLTGDFDRERGVPTRNQTGQRAGLWNTDLGASFMHGGLRYYLFGDSIPTAAGSKIECGDAIAVSSDPDPADGIDLRFLTGGDGSYLEPNVPGISHGCFEVPLDGVSVAGAMYVWFSTGGMTGSALARSTDGGYGFELVRQFSTDKFVNVSIEDAGDELVLFGSGAYRASSPYLAMIERGDLETGEVWYYAGLVDGAPIFSLSEADAAPLFEQSCIGELSVHYSRNLSGWVALYNCDATGGIAARVADQPWGPWSEPIALYDGWRDGGYCHYMHAGSNDCDQVNDPGRETEWGGVYAPYVVEDSEQGEPGREVLYFVMSVWNPYAVMLMRTEIARIGEAPGG
jgi:hypothetical protein